MTDQTLDRCPRCEADLTSTAAHCPECFLPVRDEGASADPRLSLMRSAWERDNADAARAFDPDFEPRVTEAAPAPPPRPTPPPLRDPRPAPPFAPLDGLATWAVRGLVAMVVLAVVSIASTGFEIELLGRATSGGVVTFAEGEANDTRQTWVGILWLVGYVVAAILFIRWFARAYDDVPAAGGDRRFGTGWAVGGWFVPILWLWRPKQVADDISDASGGAGRGLVTAWWTLWLIGNWLGWALTRFWSDGDDVGEWVTSDWISIASDALDVVTAVLAIRVIRTLTAGLTAAHAARVAAA